MYDSPLLLETERLYLSIPGPDWAAALVAYRDRNAAHLRNAGPWSKLSRAECARRLQRAQSQFQSGEAVELLLFPRDDADRVIGTLSFTRMVRGPLRSCGMGYGLDMDFQGRGYMYEASRRAIRFMFEEWSMHRIEADYQPVNERSGRLLRRLGFVVEGYARDYLFIAGAWRDHIRTALTSDSDDAPPPSDPVTGEIFPSG